MYKKTAKGVLNEDFRREEAVSAALASGKRVPTETSHLAADLVKSAAATDEAAAARRTERLNAVDDEYATTMGVVDPRIVISTSHNPSQRLIAFAKELSLVLPNATRINRGTHSVKQLVEGVATNGATDLIVLHESSGRPDGIIICHLPGGPTLYGCLANVVLRADIKGKEGEEQLRATLPEVYPHLIFDGMVSEVGRRVSTILKALFPVPKQESPRVVSFVSRPDAADWISFRHHYTTGTGRHVGLEELGPRFDLRVFQVKLGTLEQKEAPIEFSLRPFMKTAYKRKNLESGKLRSIAVDTKRVRQDKKWKDKDEAFKKKHRK
jgi:U3 small nucleolar ribonucleoprotein protein IMP4